MIYLLMICASFGASAQTINVLTVNGKVEVKSPSGFTAVSEGAKLKDGQVVRTGPASTAILVYPNGTKLKLNADTNITLNEEAGIDLLRGAVFALVHKEKRPHFFIKTASAVAGVRGTEFFTSYGGDESADGWLCVKSGEVEVKPVNGSKSVLVTEGLGIVIKPNKDIEPPKKYEWTNHLNWNMDAANGDIVDKTSTKSIYKDFLKHNYD